MVSSSIKLGDWAGEAHRSCSILMRHMGTGKENMDERRKVEPVIQIAVGLSPQSLKSFPQLVAVVFLEKILPDVFSNSGKSVNL
jgi:hypothetical protein